MKKQIIILCLVLVIPILASGQQIVSGEYFFDTDPGPGNGNSFVLTPDDSIDVSLSFPLSGLSTGLHSLYVRLLNDSNDWSIAEPRMINVTAPVASQNIISGEYFYDIDPGPGNGIPFTVTAADSIDLSLNVSTAGLSIGVHTLYTRVRNSVNAWSLAEPRVINVTAPAQSKNIFAAEYFFNTDPGIGNGIPVTITTPGDSIDQNLSLGVAALPVGPQVLYLRTMDSTGVWSITEPRAFNTCAGSQYGPITDFEFDIGNNIVFFTNNTVNYDSHKWIYGDGQEDTVKVNPSHDYGLGNYNVCLVSQNGCGSDTVCVNIPIVGIESITPNHVANNGYHVTFISGIFPDSLISVKLMLAGNQDILADTLFYINSNLIKANFKLQSAPIGNWDLVVTGTTFSDTLFQGFHIEIENNLMPDLQIVIPEKSLVNTYTPCRIIVTNNGNQTLYGVPVFVFMTGNIEAIMQTPFLQDSVNIIVNDSFPEHFGIVLDSLSLDSIRVGYFAIPILSPGESQTIELWYKSSALGSFEIGASAGTPLLDSAFISSQSLRVMTSCTFLPGCLQCLLDLLNFAPGPIGCVSNLISMGCSIHKVVKGPEKKGVIVDIFGNLANTMTACLLGPFGAGLKKLFVLTAAEMAGFRLLEGASKASDILGAGGSCGLLFLTAITSCIPGAKTVPPLIVGALDPNAKAGPIGYSASNYINREDYLNYTIYFENVDSATAPVLQAIITDTLDKSVLDISTLEFMQFGFGDSIYTVEINESKFTFDIDMQPGKNIILRIMGDLDTASGVLSWRYSSFDPITMNLTDSIDEGFLPPNIIDPEGKAFVSFQIKPMTGLPHQQAITNEAQIVFDSNPPFTTPAWLNTIDLQKPLSTVNTLPLSINDTLFTVHWTSVDTDAGVGHVNIYCSINDGVYFELISNGVGDSVMLIGEVGDKYEFFSIATDYVGNIEDPPVDPENFPDAVTTIVTGVEEQTQNHLQLSVIPNPFTESTTCTWYLAHPGYVRVTLTDLSGREILKVCEGYMKAGQQQCEIKGNQISRGLYFAKIEMDGNVRYEKLIKQ